MSSTPSPRTRRGCSGRRSASSQSDPLPRRQAQEEARRQAGPLPPPDGRLPDLLHLRRGVDPAAGDPQARRPHLPRRHRQRDGRRARAHRSRGRRRCPRRRARAGRGPAEAFVFDQAKATSARPLAAEDHLRVAGVSRRPGRAPRVARLVRRRRRASSMRRSLRSSCSAWWTTSFRSRSARCWRSPTSS